MHQQAGILVVGSVAQDFVDSPVTPLNGELGGSAVYFSLAARHFAPVAVVGVVGADRASELRQLLDFADLSRLSTTEQPTYKWRARRSSASADAITLERFPGGYAGYQPEVGAPEQLPPTIYLGSADPRIQLAVARASPKDALVAGDSMDVFIEGQREAVHEMVRRCRILFATVHELELLARTRGVASAATKVLDEFDLGAVVIKRGADGAVLWTRDLHQRVPAVRVDVVDPTGAGDALAGGMLGRLAEAGRPSESVMSGAAGDLLLDALEWGMVAASFAIAAPGLNGIGRASHEDMQERLDDYRRGR